MKIVTPIYFLLFGLWIISCQPKSVDQELSKITASSQPMTNPKGELLIIDKDSTELRPLEGLVYYKNKPFTGTSVIYYTKNIKAAAIQYLDGKKEGLYKKWFPDGLLSFEAYYKAGRQEGITKTWWKNGTLRSESRFKNGIPDGIQLQWYKSGNKFKRQQLVNGQEQGIQKAWRENGKIYNNYEAKNGRIFGLKRANLCFELAEEVVQYKE